MQGYRSSRTSPLLEQDIPSWTTRRTRSSSLATIYKRSNALGEAFFWDALFSYLHASTDIGEVVDWIKGKLVVATKGDLAVLHNCNKMVNAFSTTEWVSGSGGTIISRSVTSCAGMTAYLVLLAQTRVGFLSGERGKSFRQLPAQEQAAQKEEHVWVGRSSHYHRLFEV